MPIKLNFYSKLPFLILAISQCIDMALALHNYDIHVEFTYRKPNLAILVDIHKSIQLIY